MIPPPPEFGKEIRAPITPLSVGRYAAIRPPAAGQAKRSFALGNGKCIPRARRRAVSDRPGSWKVAPHRYARPGQSSRFLPAVRHRRCPRSILPRVQSARPLAKDRVWTSFSRRRFFSSPLGSFWSSPTARLCWSIPRGPARNSSERIEMFGFLSCTAAKRSTNGSGCRGAQDDLADEASHFTFSPIPDSRIGNVG